MSGGAGGASGPQGSDEAFISFAFTIVTVVAFVMYLPIVIRFVKATLGMVKRAGGSKEDAGKRRSEKNAAGGADTEEEDKNALFWADLKDHVTFIPMGIHYVIMNPTAVATSLNLLRKHKDTTLKICMPKFLRWCFRPKYFILILWCVLFSMALYSNLTFDPHGVLNLPRDATDAQVKKAYRKMTRMYHPDHNKTDAAKPIYARVKRAYKALVDSETFEKEAMQQELSAGVALPSFLTSRNNDTLVMVMMLAIIVGLPWWLYRKFSGEGEDKVGKWIDEIIALEERMIPFYYELGVPVEKKLVARRAEVAKLHGILLECGVPVRSAKALEFWPPMPELAKRVREGEKNAAMFQQLGLQSMDQVNALNSYFIANPESLVSESTTQDDTTLKVEGGVHFDATMYIFLTVMDDCNKLLDEFNEYTKGNLKSLYLLRRHHSTVLELLEWAKNGSCAARDVTALIEAPRVGRQYALEIHLNIQAIVQKMQKDQMKEQQKKMGMKHGRMQ